MACVRGGSGRRGGGGGGGSSSSRGGCSGSISSSSLCVPEHSDSCLLLGTFCGVPQFGDTRLGSVRLTTRQLHALTLTTSMHPCTSSNSSLKALRECLQLLGPSCTVPVFVLAFVLVLILPLFLLLLLLLLLFRLLLMLLQLILLLILLIVAAAPAASASIRPYRSNANPHSPRRHYHTLPQHPLPYQPSVLALGRQRATQSVSANPGSWPPMATATESLKSAQAVVVLTGHVPHRPHEEQGPTLPSPPRGPKPVVARQDSLSLTNRQRLSLDLITLAARAQTSESAT